MEVKYSQFLNAANRVKELKSKPSDEDLLQLYGLYKQATIGDINIPRPAFWDAKGQAKYDAWSLYQTVPKEKAMFLYIRLVKKLES
jgi:diazepam-binding inhibitor (GABA receptor modulating acyl-CoA-binding protein)